MVRKCRRRSRSELQKLNYYYPQMHKITQEYQAAKKPPGSFLFKRSKDHMMFLISNVGIAEIRRVGIVKIVKLLFIRKIKLTKARN